jgi:ribonuclease HI
MASVERTPVQIYTDGGCDPNPGPGGWGAVLIAGLRTREASGGDIDSTNNRMELTAAISALRLLNQSCDVTVYTDSQYLRKGITQWVDGWIANNWRKANGRPVENVDLWIELLRAMEPHHVRWEWIKGHRGNPLNERADQLAREARRKLQAGEAMPQPVIPTEIALPELCIYASGCALGNPGPGGYAAVLLDAEGNDRVVSGSWPMVTANVMQLWAAVVGLQALKQISRVTVYSTSKYLLDGATQWLAEWERRGWRISNGQPLRNKEVWAELANVLGDHDVEWTYLENANRDAHYRRAAQIARKEAERASA